MTSRRHTVLIADRTTGAVRRLTINLRPTLLAAAAVYMLPVVVGVATGWSALSDARDLRSANAALLVENSSYRAATGELTTQIQSLEGIINDIGQRASIDPTEARAMAKLPDVIRSRAMGGSDVATPPPNPADAAPSLDRAKSSPEDIFGGLKKMLQSLENRLSYVRRDVERTEALSNATPSIWPAHGWLTGTFGGRSDPFTGEPAYHTGLDISLEKGSPVFATADGRVESTSYTGDYGNLIVLQHGFGLTTRYGHLSAYRVRPGDVVKRGDVIGLVGATGRATGAHLHYEILINGKLTDPLKLLIKPVPNAASH